MPSDRWQTRGMTVKSVDPRDGDWEIHDPRYRVYLRADDGATSEFEFSDESLQSVLEWVAQNRQGRGYSIYAAVEVDGRLGLICLEEVQPDPPRALN